jgi:hypothetical protein
LTAEPDKKPVSLNKKAAAAIAANVFTAARRTYRRIGFSPNAARRTSRTTLPRRGQKQFRTAGINARPAGSPSRTCSTKHGKLIRAAGAVDASPRLVRSRHAFRGAKGGGDDNARLRPSVLICRKNPSPFPLKNNVARR